MLSVLDISNDKFVKFVSERIAEEINKVANGSDEEFDLNIAMLTTPLSKTFISELSDLMESLEISLDDLPDTITLDELYKNNKDINDINNNMSVVERLKEARKNRFAFKPGEAGPVEHSGSGVSRSLSNKE